MRSGNWPCRSPKPRPLRKAGEARLWAVTRVNAEQASKVKSRRRAPNERAKAAAGWALNRMAHSGRRGNGNGTQARFQAKRGRSRVPGAVWPQRRERRRGIGKSERVVVPWKPLITAEGRDLTFGVLAREIKVQGDWR